MKYYLYAALSLPWLLTACTPRIISSPVDDSSVFGQPSGNVIQQLQAFNGPSQMLRIGNEYAVADPQNNRILIYGSLPTAFPPIPEAVVGQPDAQSNAPNNGGISASTLSNPGSIATDGTRLIVGDGGNNRILIWNTLPTTSFAPADVVVGQANFVSASPGLSASQFGTFTGGTSGSAVPVATNGVALYVSDPANCRVLIFNSIPTTNGASANFVLGEPDFVTNNQEAGNTGFTAQGSSGLFIQGGYLFAADGADNRVMVWTLPITANNQAANYVIGQTNFTNYSANQGASAAANTLSYPTAISGNGSSFLIMDSLNNRMLGYPMPPSTNESATLVLGQSNFGATASNQGASISAWTLALSSGSLAKGGQITAENLYFDGTSLFAADAGNNRILVWDHFPTVNGQSADQIIGQPSTSTGSVGGLTDMSSVVNSPTSVAIKNNQLFVVSTTDSRVQVWDPAPATISNLPSFIIGQSSLNENMTYAPYGTVNAQGLGSPASVEYDGTYLYVADTSRILMFNPFPSASLPTASLALGVSSFTQSSFDPGGPTHIGRASQLAMDGTRLYLSDVGSTSRVLIWNTLPTTLDQPADLELGEKGLNSTVTGCTTISQSSLCHPKGVAVGNQHLVVSDTNVNRILIWNSIPTVNRQPADLVLGQSTFTATSCVSPVTPSSLCYPNQIWTDGTRLVVADTRNNRVLIWHTFPTTNNAPADTVIGQPDLYSSDANNGGLSATSLNGPVSVAVYNGVLYVADQNNYRVVTFNMP